MWFSYCKSSVLAHSTSLEGISTTENLTITFIHQQLQQSITSTETTPAPTSRHRCCPDFVLQIPNINLWKNHPFCICDGYFSMEVFTSLSVKRKLQNHMVFKLPLLGTCTLDLSRGDLNHRRIYNHIRYISNYTIASHQPRLLQHLPTDIHAA